MKRKVNKKRKQKKNNKRDAAKEDFPKIKPKTKILAKL